MCLFVRFFKKIKNNYENRFQKIMNEKAVFSEKNWGYLEYQFHLCYENIK